MDPYHDQPLGLSPPKILCLPVRPVVCFFAALSVIGRIALLISAESWGIRVSNIIFLFLNVLLLFGAARNNEVALKWSQRVVMISVILAIIAFFIWPVAAASFYASGLASNTTFEKSMDSVESYAEVLRDETPKERMFVRGLITGYAVEIAGVLGIGLEILKYTLVHRLWIYAKATESIGTNIYIAP